MQNGKKAFENQLIEHIAQNKCRKRAQGIQQDLPARAFVFQTASQKRQQQNGGEEWEIRLIDSQRTGGKQASAEERRPMPLFQQIRGKCHQQDCKRIVVDGKLEEHHSADRRKGGCDRSKREAKPVVLQFEDAGQNRRGKCQQNQRDNTVKNRNIKDAPDFSRQLSEKIQPPTAGGNTGTVAFGEASNHVIIIDVVDEQVEI